MNDGNWFGKKISSFRDKVATMDGFENIKTQTNKFSNRFQMKKEINSNNYDDLKDEGLNTDNNSSKHDKDKTTEKDSNKGSKLS